MDRFTAFTVRYLSTHHYFSLRPTPAYLHRSSLTTKARPHPSLL